MHDMSTPTLYTPMVPHAGCHPLSDRERETLAEHGRTWQVVQDAGREVIQCLVCRRVSYHADDKLYLFCSACNAFHDERLRLWESEQVTLPPSEEKP